MMTPETDFLKTLAEMVHPLLGKSLHSIGSDSMPTPDSLETYTPGTYYGNLMVRFTGKKECLSMVKEFGMYGHGQGGLPYEWLELHDQSLPRLFADDYDGASGYSSSIRADLNVYPFKWPELFHGLVLTGVWAAVVRDSSNYGPGDYLCGIALKFARTSGRSDFVENELPKPWFFGMCFKPHDEEGESYRTIFARSLPDIDGNRYPWIRVVELEEG